MDFRHGSIAPTFLLQSLIMLERPMALTRASAAFAASILPADMSNADKLRPSRSSRATSKLRTRTSRLTREHSSFNFLELEAPLKAVFNRRLIQTALWRAPLPCFA